MLGRRGQELQSVGTLLIDGMDSYSVLQSAWGRVVGAVTVEKTLLSLGEWAVDHQVGRMVGEYIHQTQNQ